MGRGARDAYRWVPRDAPDPPWSVGTNLGEENAESGVQSGKTSHTGVVNSLTGLKTPSSRYDWCPGPG